MSGNDDLVVAYQLGLHPGESALLMCDVDLDRTE